MSDENRIRLIASQPIRGKILDKNGYVLADSRVKYSLIIKPQSVNKDNWEKHKSSISEIVDIIDFSEDKFQDFIDDNLLTIENYKLTIFKKGRLFTRNIAMRFDPLIKQNVGTYSNTI